MVDLINPSLFGIVPATENKKRHSFMLGIDQESNGFALNSGNIGQIFY